MDRNQPLGISLVCILTVLVDLELWLWALFLFTVRQTIGESGTLLATNEWLWGGFGVLFLVDTILILRSLRAGYFLSMASWILLFPADISVGYWGGLFSGYFTVSLFSFLFICNVLYPVVCFVYFLRKNVRVYFGT